MAIKTVGVLGCGLMGSGVAQVSAAAGYKTIVADVHRKVLDRGMARIQKFLDDGIAKGKLTTEQKDQTLGNLTATTEMAAMKDCDLIIEAIIEHVDDKVAAYKLLEAAVVGCRPSLRPTPRRSASLSSPRATNRPDRFGGLHFFNPVPLMKLVEVIRALTTSRRDVRRAFRVRASRSARSRSRRPTSRDSSSIACWCPTCSTPSGATSTGWARSRTSTRA